MTKEESEAIGWARMLEIDAQRKAGLPHTEVFALQIVAAVEQYQRDLVIEKEGRWHA
jgi:hypothetical protein